MVVTRYGRYLRPLVVFFGDGSPSNARSSLFCLFFVDCLRVLQSCRYTAPFLSRPTPVPTLRHSTCFFWSIRFTVKCSPDFLYFLCPSDLTPLLGRFVSFRPRFRDPVLRTLPGSCPSRKSRRPYFEWYTLSFLFSSLSPSRVYPVPDTRSYPAL